MPVNHKKQERKIPLYGLFAFLKGSGSLDRTSDILSLLCFSRDSVSNQSVCIYILIYTKIMKKQSFLLPQLITINPEQRVQDENLEITYYSDCVFKPYIHKFQQKEITLQENGNLTLNFGFLIEAIKTNPKVLDNIGVLKISKSEKYGILVTKQKEGIFVSLID